MNTLENHVYLAGYIISNLAGVLLLYLAWTNERIARALFSVLFAWASWVNWRTALNAPQVYLDYANLTFLPVYKNFILGWFSEHILVSVGFIATCQGLTAVALLCKGWVYKLGIIAGVIFLVSIFPFGVGSAFPCTLVMAAAMTRLFAASDHYIWQRKIHIAAI